MNWATAITTCEALELGGYSDWRLPNYNELYQLADRAGIIPLYLRYFSILPLAIIGVLLPLRPILALRGVSLSTVAMTIGAIRPVPIMRGALEADNEIIDD